MQVKAIIPKAPEVLREAIIVMAGAMLAAALVRGLPENLQKYFSWPGAKE